LFPKDGPAFGLATPVLLPGPARVLSRHQVFSVSARQQPGTLKKDTPSLAVCQVAVSCFDHSSVAFVLWKKESSGSPKYCLGFSGTAVLRPPDSECCSLSSLGLASTPRRGRLRRRMVVKAAATNMLGSACLTSLTDGRE